MCIVGGTDDAEPWFARVGRVVEGERVFFFCRADDADDALAQACAYLGWTETDGAWCDLADVCPPSWADEYTDADDDTGWNHSDESGRRGYYP